MRKALATRPQPKAEDDEKRRTGPGTLYGVEEIGAHLASLPRHWGLCISGDCMAPQYGHGEVVVVDKEGWPKRGDVAVIYIEGEVEGRRVVMPWIKRVIMPMWQMTLPPKFGPGNELIPLLSIESNLPDSQRTFPATQLHGLFKVVGRHSELQLIGDTLVPKKKPRKRAVGNGKAGHGV